MAWTTEDRCRYAPAMQEVVLTGSLRRRVPLPPTGCRRSIPPGPLLGAGHAVTVAAATAAISFADKGRWRGRRDGGCKLMGRHPSLDGRTRAAAWSRSRKTPSSAWESARRLQIELAEFAGDPLRAALQVPEHGHAGPAGVRQLRRVRPP